MGAAGARALLSCLSAFGPSQADLPHVCQPIFHLVLVVVLTHFKTRKSVPASRQRFEDFCTEHLARPTRAQVPQPRCWLPCKSSGRPCPVTCFGASPAGGRDKRERRLEESWTQTRIYNEVPPVPPLSLGWSSLGHFALHWRLSGQMGSSPEVPGGGRPDERQKLLVEMAGYQAG